MPDVPYVGKKPESMRGYKKTTTFQLLLLDMILAAKILSLKRWLNTPQPLWLTWRKLYPTSDSGIASSWDQVALSGRWERGSPYHSHPVVPVLFQQQDTKQVCQEHSTAVLTGWVLPCGLNATLHQDAEGFPNLWCSSSASSIMAFPGRA